MGSSCVNDAIQRLRDRGLLYQSSNEFVLADKLARGDDVAFYVGFDCTAPSLHVGSLLVINAVRILAESGLRPIVVLGSVTTLIGDPSGKSAARRAPGTGVVADNIVALRKQIKSLLSPDVLVVDNNWLAELSLLDFFDQVGSCMTVNRAISFDYISRRLSANQSLMLKEFLYMFLQGYDFLYLHNHYNCWLQIGGSDQWANMLCGTDIVKSNTGHEVCAITLPLLLKRDGSKMGKTEQGALWLNSELCDAYSFWHHLRNIDDAMAMTVALQLTGIPETILQEWMDGGINLFKERVAYAVLRDVHGDAACELVGAKISSPDVSGARVDCIVYNCDLDKQLRLFDLISRLVGDVVPNTRIKEWMRAGGVLLNGDKIYDVGYTLRRSDFTHSLSRIDVGKTRRYLVRLGD